MRLTGWETRVVSVDVDERPDPGESARALASRLAQAKANRAAQAKHAGVLLAADTIVVDEGRLLGKPQDEQHALRMLEALRGRTHSVVTALAIVDPASEGPRIDVCETAVPMRPYALKELRAYVSSGRAFDKAGGYGIQDEDFRPVDSHRMRGCFANVMGLPLCHLVRAMRSLGYQAPNDVPEACEAYTGYACPVYAEILRA